VNLPTLLTQACRQGRLLLVWGVSPFPLAERPPAKRALLLKRWVAEAPPSPTLPLYQLPPLPILSLDPTDWMERAFAQANVPLQVVCARHDAPARGRHVLLKLAGDLGTRSGVLLSRAELRELHSDPDKRYLLNEAHRLARNGAALLLGCDPASEDWRAWRPVLAPALVGASFFALGEPGAAWPEGMVCLGQDFQAVSAALWEAQPIGDEARIEQYFAAPAGTTQGSWEALMAQVTARLDDLSAQLGQGVEDLKRGQTALYRRVDRAYRDDLARILTAVQQGRLEQGEMQATLDALRRAMRTLMERGLPMDVELRAAIAGLTEAVESNLSLERKLELSLPLIPPFLEYKIELAVDTMVDLHDVWDELRERWGGLVAATRLTLS